MKGVPADRLREIFIKEESLILSLVSRQHLWISDSKKNGFLHASDVLIPSENGSQSSDTDAHGKPHREFRKIRDLLHPGKEVLVQVTKESIGTKGPSLTTYISLPGRFLVLTPDVPRHGVSRKIASDEERLRLKKNSCRINTPRKYWFYYTNRRRTADKKRDPQRLSLSLKALEEYRETDKRRQSPCYHLPGK